MNLGVSLKDGLGLRVSVLHPGSTPLGNDPEWFKITRFYPGNVPKWGQDPVGVFPECHTKSLGLGTLKISAP